jgi:glycosyltransferase involved in cell wall biosynthesis
MTKPVILTLVNYYLPGYKAGGTIRSLANLVQQLGDEFFFKIVTNDRDHQDRAPYPDVRVNGWNEVGKASVYYVSTKMRTLAGIRRILLESGCDVLYPNSLLSPWFSILPLVLRRLRLIPPRPVVLAPRGEFAPGAMALKTRRKKAFWHAARAAGLFRDLTWQAGSPDEARDMRAWLGPAQPIMVARDPSGAIPSKVRPQGHGRQGPLRVVFLARISAIKNLEGALAILRGIRGQLLFDIYGPIEDDAIWNRCRAAIAALPVNVTARYRGVLTPGQVPEVLAGYDVFFLPSGSESFGHVILEALAAGLPVVISDRTPWRDLAAAGVGFDLPLERPELFGAAFEKILAASAEELDAWSARAHAFALKRLTDPEAGDQHRELFTRALAKAGP